MILKNGSVLAVRDADATAKFFIEVLGFETYLQPEGWHFVKRDEWIIMLGSCPDDLPASETGCHSYFAYLWVDDADAMYQEFVARGWSGGAPQDKPWGLREFTVRTPDGHRMCFGQHL